MSARPCRGCDRGCGCDDDRERDYDYGLPTYYAYDHDCGAHDSCLHLNFLLKTALFMNMSQAHLQQLANVRVNQAVIDDTANLAHRDDFLVAQNPQLVRDRGIIAS